MSAVTAYLLDTNIISHMMRYPQGVAAQRVFQFATEGASVQLCTSVVVDCELRVGLQKISSPQWRLRFDAAMASLAICPLTPEVSAFYAQLRHNMAQRGQPMGPNDLLIAAHALQLQATLVSADQAFARIPHLKIENWLSQTPA